MLQESASFLRVAARFSSAPDAYVCLASDAPVTLLELLRSPTAPFAPAAMQPSLPATARPLRIESPLASAR